MAKYTTTVRSICEVNSGLEESGELSKVGDVLEKSWDKIFDVSIPLFDEKYRKILCKKILSHYYMREICCETVGLWKLWLNQKMFEIMPYYNKLYESELLKVEPFNDVDYTRKGNRGSTKTGTNSEDNTRASKGTNNGKSLYSDTPQGSVGYLESMSYLTNATIESGENTVNDTVKNSGNFSENGDEEYTENVKGKMNTKSYSSLLKEYRESFLNIDMQIISELEELFFGLW